MAENFENAVVALLPNLRRFALSLCRNTHTADDLVQGTCEKAFANKSSFQTGTRLDAWLFRILRNLWIDRLRKDKTEGQAEDIDEAVDLPESSSDPAAETQLLLRQVSDLITKLPQVQREVIMLVCVEDLSYREAAETLDVPIGTVMSRLARARQEILRLAGIT
jgi:RNA polymerase sigma-70 factor, ECF subfamily